MILAAETGSVKVLERPRAESNGNPFPVRENQITGSPIPFREETRTAETPQEPDDSRLSEMPTPRFPWAQPREEWLPPAQTLAAVPITRDHFQERILRAHFLGPILDALRKLQPHIGSPGSITYIDSLFCAIRQMMEHSPEDPFLEVLLAFYDALTFNHSWARYTAKQYAEAYKVLKQLSSQQHIHMNAVERAIMKLEDIGFDTTPYTLEIVEEEV